MIIIKLVIKLFLIASLVTFPSIRICAAQNQTEQITHYILPDFVEGVVLMKSGIKNEVSINYNSLSEEMIFTKGSVKLAIGNTESELIDTIYMDNHTFIRLAGKFVEVLYSSGDLELFVQYKCKFKIIGRPVGLGRTSSTTNVDTYSSIQGDGRFYDLKLPEEYEVSPYQVYWIKKDGYIYEIVNMKRLERLFKNHKDQLRKFVKDNNISFDDPIEIQSLVKHIDKQL